MPVPLKVIKSKHIGPIKRGGGKGDYLMTDMSLDQFMMLIPFPFADFTSCTFDPALQVDEPDIGSIVSLSRTLR